MNWEVEILFFSLGMFDGKPVMQGTEERYCTACGYSGTHYIYTRKRWLLLLIIPLPVNVSTYTQCPRCGFIEECEN